MTIPAGQLELLLQFYYFGGNPLDEQNSPARQGWTKTFLEIGLIRRGPGDIQKYKMTELGNQVVKRVLEEASKIILY